MLAFGVLVAGCNLVGGLDGYWVDPSYGPAGGGVGGASAASSSRASSASSSGAQGSSSAETSATAGVGGGPVGCDPMTCPGQDTECSARACINNMCGFTYNKPGDKCMGNQYCDGAGNCVECTQNEHCPSKVCNGNKCYQASCNNKIHDSGAGETDTDCGGPECPPCEHNKKCGQNGDCQSKICSGGICTPCTKEGDCQSGFYCDSGGLCRAKKALFSGCLSGKECLSGKCCLFCC
jgi:hypothetical protein